MNVHSFLTSILVVSSHTRHSQASFSEYNNSFPERVLAGSDTVTETTLMFAP